MNTLYCHKLIANYIHHIYVNTYSSKKVLHCFASCLSKVSLSGKWETSVISVRWSGKANVKYHVFKNVWVHLCLIVFCCILVFMCVLCCSAMESHGECEIKVQLNCSHCQTQSCKRAEDTHIIFCLCEDDEVLASDNVTCISAFGKYLLLMNTTFSFFIFFLILFKQKLKHNNWFSLQLLKTWLRGARYRHLWSWRSWSPPLRAAWHWSAHLLSSVRDFSSSVCSLCPPPSTGCEHRWKLFPYVTGYSKNTFIKYTFKCPPPAVCRMIEGVIGKIWFRHLHCCHNFNVIIYGHV